MDSAHSQPLTSSHLPSGMTAGLTLLWPNLLTNPTTLFPFLKNQHPH